MSFEIDHIFAEKHGGATSIDNLCLSCPDCNVYKGSDVASVDLERGVVVPLFHPRRQAWDDHFRLEGAKIVGITPEGRVTVTLIQTQLEQMISDVEIQNWG